MFEPEKCSKCGKTTDVEHYDTGWRCICDYGWYGISHFDKELEKPRLTVNRFPPPSKLRGIQRSDL
ncbi:hypothetical protein ACFLWC_00480 [Chloroflexota bacterium]